MHPTNSFYGHSDQNEIAQGNLRVKYVPCLRQGASKPFYQQGVIIFYREGAVCLWGAEFFEVVKGAVFFPVGQRGGENQNIQRVTERGTRIFTHDGDLNFFAPSVQRNFFLIIINFLLIIIPNFFLRLATFFLWYTSWLNQLQCIAFMFSWFT